MDIYALLLLVIVILYPFCRWVAGFKGRHTEWWLSYLRCVDFLGIPCQSLYVANLRGGRHLWLSESLHCLPTGEFCDFLTYDLLMEP